MLTMDQQQCIRTMRQWLGMSLADIEDETGLSFRTVKKYADGGDQDPSSRQRDRPVIGPYEETIDLWIEEDLSEPAKQRRTAQDIFEQLKEKHGYEGSARTVRRYVRTAKQRIIEAHNEQYLTLDHPPGEGQVDLGDVWVTEPERDRRSVRKLLLITFPYSTTRFGVLLPAENRECLFLGLNQLFEQMGGVPPKLVFDNLSPVVSWVQGERHLTEPFKRFQMHYRFQAEFCNPGKGNEKGSVETGIETVRHWHLTPPPVVDNGDLTPINETLAEGLKEDRNRSHYEKDTSVNDLWKQEQKKLLTCPREPFEACRVETRTVSRVGEITVDDETYHLPWCHPGQKVLMKLFWDRLEVLDEEQQHLGSVPREYQFRAEDVDWAATLKLVEPKPRAIEQATILKRFPDALREFLIDVPMDERPERVRTLITFFESGYGLQDVQTIVKRGQKLGRIDETGLRMVAGLEEDSSESLPEVPDEMKDWEPDLRSYDGLVQGGDFNE